MLFDEVQRAGARLLCVTERFEENAVGRFILAARAFTAEVEREKIVERTMRGKGERARSGRLPQGTGKGCYGYRYDPATGKRTIDPAQGVIVQRIFAQFREGGSCHGIAVTLNREEIPTLAGNPWHPLTVRRLLENEIYAGRTIYRRTRVDEIRDPRTGRMRRRVQQRDAAEWIDVIDATPRLISDDLFARAQAILVDPERRLRGKPSRLYRLRGHVVCAACGTPMVGQALMQGRFSYYRCRKSCGGKTEGTCRSRYIRAALLEQTVFAEIASLLSQPERVLAEARRLVAQEQEASDLLRLEQALHGIEEQQRRLVRLYTAGTLPEDMLSEESARLNRERMRRRPSASGWLHARPRGSISRKSPPTCPPSWSDFSSLCATSMARTLSSY